MVEPSGISAQPCGVVTYGVPTNHAGGIGMRLAVYVNPSHVSFSALMFEEIPCERGAHGGYFNNPYFSGIWCHSTENGAGIWNPISVIDNRVGGEGTVDTVAISSELLRADEHGNFTCALLRTTE